MKVIRIVLTGLASIIILYIILGVVIDLILYINRDFIENKTREILSVDKVTIKGFFNVPFFNFDIKDVEISDHNIGKLILDRTTISYNITRLPSLAAISSINLGGISCKSDISKINDLIDKIKYIIDLNTNNVNFKLAIDKINIDENFGLGINGNLLVRDFDIKADTKFVTIKMNARAMVSDPANIYFNSDLQIKLDFNLSNNSLSGNAGIMSLNAAGLSVIQDEWISLTNNSNITVSSSVPGLFSNDNGKISIDFGQDYIVHNGNNISSAGVKQDYLINKMLLPGKYYYKIDASYYNGNLNAGLQVFSESNNNSDRIQLTAFGSADGLRFHTDIDTVKSGKIKTEIFLSRDSGYLPTGIIELNNVPFYSGLMKTDAWINMISKGNTLVIYADNTKLNGGTIGSVYTKMQFNPNSIDFDSGGAGSNCNIQVNGTISSKFYKIFVNASNLDGNAVVSNIYFNILDIGKCFYTGNMIITNDSNGSPVMSAHAWGNKTGQERWVDVMLRYENNVLYLPAIVFNKAGLDFNVNVAFDFTNILTNYIFIDGAIGYQNKLILPMHGALAMDNLNGVSRLNLAIDSNVVITTMATSNYTDLKLSAFNKNLDKFGLKGVLNLSYNTIIYYNALDYLKIDASLSAFNRQLSFNMSATAPPGEVNEKMNIDNLVIDDQAQKLTGSGQIWMNGDFFSGQIFLQNVGGVIFNATTENINATVSLTNFLIKNFPSSGNDALVSGNIIAYGPLIIPDFRGNLKIINSQDSSEFLVNIPYMAKSGGNCSISNFQLLNGGVTLKMDSSLSFYSNETAVSSSGSLLISEIFKGKFNFNYDGNDSYRKLTYNLYSILLSGKNISNISGGVSEQNGDFILYRDGSTGLAGFYSNNIKYSDWDIDFSLPPYKGKFSGGYDNWRDNLNSVLSINMPLDFLSRMQIFDGLTGNCGIDVTINGPRKNFNIEGSCKLSHINAGFHSVNSTIKDFSSDIPIVESKINLSNMLLPTSRGNFILNGLIDISDFQNLRFNIMAQPENSKTALVLLNLNSDNLKISGEAVIRKFIISGDNQNMEIGGDVLAQNDDIQIPVVFNLAGNEVKGPEEKIYWNLPVTIGDGVKFDNNVINVMMKKTGELQILGSSQDGSLSLKGDLGIIRGSLTYLGNAYTLDDGTVNFSGEQGDLMPYINLNSIYNYIDSSGNKVNVYLIFEGKVPKIYIGDLYSIPNKTSDELSNQIGLKPDEDLLTNSGYQAADQSFIAGGLSMAENAFIISPLTMDLKRRLGLDIFNVRSDFFENWMTNQLYSSQNYSDLFEGTSLWAGKYLFPSVMVQYGLVLSKNPFSDTQLIPLNAIGVDFDLKNIDFQWMMQQTSISGVGVGVQQQIQFNYNSRF